MRVIPNRMHTPEHTKYENPKHRALPPKNREQLYAELKYSSLKK